MHQPIHPVDLNRFHIRNPHSPYLVRDSLSAMVLVEGMVRRSMNAAGRKIMDNVIEFPSK